MKGLPLANIILSPTIENASSGVHSAVRRGRKQKERKKKHFISDILSTKAKGMTTEVLPFFVGFDMAKIAGLVEVDPLKASNT